MTYIFQFGPVFAAFDSLITGALLTIQLTGISVLFGLAVAILCTYGRLYGATWLRRSVAVYVEAIRNTPLLVQLFFVFFGLPAIGLKLSPNEAAVLTMAANLGAYASEILRSGVEAVPRGQIEAGLALGLRPAQIFRFVIFRPALRVAFPALASQFVLLLLGSSVVSAIAAEDLTAVANVLQSRTFRSFEVYFVVLLLYLGMAIFFRLAFRLLYRVLFERQGWTT